MSTESDTELLTIKLQKRLSLARQLEITVYGIHHRLWRSSLTLGVVTIAVAFLMNVLTESTISNSLKGGVQAQAERERTLSRMATMLEPDLDRDGLRRGIAEMPDSGWPLTALATRVGLSDEALAALRADCIASVRYERWFENLKPGQRRQLFAKANLAETYSRLATVEAGEALAKEASEIPLRLPRGFIDFAVSHGAFEQRLDAVLGELATMRAAATETMGGMPFTAWVATGEPAVQKATLAELGMALDDAQWAALRGQATARVDEQRLAAMLQKPQLMRQWAVTYDERFQQDKVLARLATDPEAAQLVLDASASPDAAAGDAARMTPAELMRIAGALADRRRILNLSAELRLKYGDQPGLDPVTFWLMVVSLLVCVAGISNAMLVNVLERFREIATMKCLGALNGFIAMIFLFEATFLGLVGGILGALLGAVIGVLRMLSSYGRPTLSYFHWLDLLPTAGICLACGIGLTVVAALYPAFSAARMAPMEAMRVE